MRTCEIAAIRHHLVVNVEAVCRYYLALGRKVGRYWIVGNIHNKLGQSMAVRLYDTNPERIGLWVDYATGEHGDVFDLIGSATGIDGFKDILAEACRFLNMADLSALPHPSSFINIQRIRQRKERNSDSVHAARRLFDLTKPIKGTLAEKYLLQRGLTNLSQTQSLRFLERCYYTQEDGKRLVLPAMIAAVTDGQGNITGVQRTWLSEEGHKNTAVLHNVKALGRIRGAAVRFGQAKEQLLVGEGIETVLSLAMALPLLPMAACLSANHLAAFDLPAALRHLLITQDNDPPGHRLAIRLATRAQRIGITTCILTPRHDDFNTDLQHMGKQAFIASVRDMLIASNCIAPDTLLCRPPTMNRISSGNVSSHRCGCQCLIASALPDF